jgi:hypothetical protein
VADLTAIQDFQLVQQLLRLFVTLTQIDRGFQSHFASQWDSLLSCFPVFPSLDDLAVLALNVLPAALSLSPCPVTLETLDVVAASFEACALPGYLHVQLISIATTRPDLFGDGFEGFFEAICEFVDNTTLEPAVVSLTRIFADFSDFVERFTEMPIFQDLFAEILGRLTGRPDWNPYLALMSIVLTNSGNQTLRNSIISQLPWHLVLDCISNRAADAKEEAQLFIAAIPEVMGYITDVTGFAASLISQLREGSFAERTCALELLTPLSRECDAVATLLCDIDLWNIVEGLLTNGDRQLIQITLRFLDALIESAIRKPGSFADLFGEAGPDLLDLLESLIDEEDHVCVALVPKLIAGVMNVVGLD